MGILSPNDRLQVSKRLATLAGPVRLIVFHGGEADADRAEYGRILAALVQELAELSDMIKVEVAADDAQRVLYNIERTPALAMVKADGTDTRIRFYGIPGGYEFATLLADLDDVAADRIVLSPETLTALEQVTTPLTISVFVTPT